VAWAEELVLKDKGTVLSTRALKEQKTSKRVISVFVLHNILRGKFGSFGK
jgi:hypothetical protein